MTTVSPPGGGFQPSQESCKLGKVAVVVPIKQRETLRPGEQDNLVISYAAESHNS